MRDPHRPSYHFLPPANFTCDAFGLIHWKGRYHLFYQYQPHSTVLAAGVWAHAVSDDLVRWEHLPFALVPTPGGPDRAGCCSGRTVDNDGVPTIVYTGAPPGWPYTSRPCIATGSDDLVRWAKHPSNPVIREPPARDWISPGFVTMRSGGRATPGINWSAVASTAWAARSRSTRSARSDPLGLPRVAGDRRRGADRRDVGVSRLLSVGRPAGAARVSESIGVGGLLRGLVRQSDLRR